MTQDTETPQEYRERIEHQLEMDGIYQFVGGEDADARFGEVCSRASTPAITIDSTELGEKEVWDSARSEARADEAESIIVVDFDVADEEDRTYAAQVMKGIWESTDATIYVTASKEDVIYRANPDLSGRVLSVDVGLLRR